MPLKCKEMILCTTNVFGGEISFHCYILQKRYQSKELFNPLKDYNIDLIFTSYATYFTRLLYCTTIQYNWNDSPMSKRR